MFKTLETDQHKLLLMSWTEGTCYATSQGPAAWFSRWQKCSVGVASLLPFLQSKVHVEDKSWSVAVSHIGSEPECGQYSASELLRLVVAMDSYEENVIKKPDKIPSL